MTFTPSFVHADWKITDIAARCGLPAEVVNVTSKGTPFFSRIPPAPVFHPSRSSIAAAAAGSSESAPGSFVAYGDQGGTMSSAGMA